MTKRPPGWAPVNIYDDGGPEWVAAAPAYFAERSVPGVNPDYGYMCLSWTKHHTTGGYGLFMLGGRMMRAHRAVLELKLGRPITLGLFAIHSCDYPSCIDPEHLREGTPKDNAQDMQRRGRARHPRGDSHGLRLHPERRARGDRNGMAKLTEDEAMAALERVASGKTQRNVAKDLGVHFSTINHIVKGRTWPHLPRTT